MIDIKERYKRKIIISDLNLCKAIRLFLEHRVSISNACFNILLSLRTIKSLY